MPQSWADEGPDVYVVPPPRFLGDWFAPDQLKGTLGLLSKADVVHLHAVWERMNAQVATLCRRVGTPYVITLRGMLDDWCMAQRPLKKRIYLSFAGRKYLEGAAFVHCTAEGEREQSARWFPQGTPRVIPNLIDLTPYQELPSTSLAQEAFEPLRGEGPCLLFLSRLHEKKGLEHLIEAMPKLAQSYPGVQLLLAGTGSDTYIDMLMDLARDMNVTDRVHQLGHVGGPLKLSLYRAADVFVLPSSQENFGFVQFEALACGTPVITTKLVDTWREVEASGGGIAVEQSADALVESLDPLLGDADQRMTMGEAGRAWVLEHLATERVAGLLEAMYKDAARGD